MTLILAKALHPLRCQHGDGSLGPGQEGWGWWVELCNTGTGARYQISPITTINSIITARLLPGSESGQYKEVLIGPNGPEEDIFNRSQLCCWAFEFFVFYLQIMKPCMKTGWNTMTFISDFLSRFLIFALWTKYLECSCFCWAVSW